MLKKGGGLIGYISSFFNCKYSESSRYIHFNLDFLIIRWKNSYFLPQSGRMNARGNLEIDCGSCDIYLQFLAIMTAPLYQILTKDEMLLEKYFLFHLYILTNSLDFCSTNILLFFRNWSSQSYGLANPWILVNWSSIWIVSLCFFPRNW